MSAIQCSPFHVLVPELVTGSPRMKQNINKTTIKKKKPFDTVF